uniref:Uncharacterized protein n=1 Tax=Medicago truncatula TaxID=3880 RepID=A2Q4H6_MEDTR|nr:hypothetical protein MtrDRAFT_AC157488g18v2 [Medicago truncatula]
MWCHRPNDNVQSATLAWSKPHAYWIKCKVDCALFKVDEKFGVSISFRYSLGHLMQAHSMVTILLNNSSYVNEQGNLLSNCSICFRDSLGHLMQAHSMVFPFVISAAEYEVTALQEALQIALELCLNRDFTHI